MTDNWGAYFSDPRYGQVAQTLDAPGVRKAYLKRALQLHPNKANKTPAAQAIAENAFKRLQKHYTDAQRNGFVQKSSPATPARQPANNAARRQAEAMRQAAARRQAEEVMRQAAARQAEAMRQAARQAEAMRQSPGMQDDDYLQAAEQFAANPPPGWDWVGKARRARAFVLAYRLYSMEGTYIKLEALAQYESTAQFTDKDKYFIKRIEARLRKAGKL